MTKVFTADQAVSAQLKALPNGRYEVGIFDAQTEKMALRTWDAAGVMRSLPYLKSQNVAGKHVYLRPEGPHAYSLIDDLDAPKVAALKSAGFAPALVIETSPGNLQAWIAHGVTLDHNLSTAVAKRLAARFGGDPSSADWRHFGRLAGFTNRKPKYQRDDGRFPFVRILEATGEIATASEALIAEAAQQLADELQAESERRAQFKDAPAPTGKIRKTIDDFRNASAYQGDHHRSDLAYATYALSRGASAAEVEAALRTRDLSHKGGVARQQDYIDRTIGKAMEQVGRT